MSIFGRLFKWFNKDIVQSDEIDSHLVYYYPLRKKTLKVNSNIEIKPYYCVVVVNGGKVTDKLSAGMHKINASTMPGVFQKLKLGKPTKRGNYKNKFKADIYYVNLNTIKNFKYTSGGTFNIRNERFGRVKGYSEGFCNLKIENAEELLAHLFRIARNFKKSNINILIGNIIGDSVNKIIERSKADFSEILVRPQIINDSLNNYVNLELRNYGIRAENIQLHSLILSSRAQKKVADFLNNYTEYLPNISAQNIINYASSTEDSNINKVEVNEEIELNKTETNNIDINKTVGNENFNNASNILFNRRLNDKNLLESEKAVNNTSSSYSNTNINAKDILNNTDEKKVCKYCGKVIDSSYKFCPQCGFKQY